MGGRVRFTSYPGASGYAAVYFSRNFRFPIVLLAGFDLNESHLAEEEIEYGMPAVTAADVVDRETLKAFVTQAGEAFLDQQKGGDLSATSKARVALRDPNGPWRHGSVYLYVLDLTTNIVLFHGAFPDIFELRPLVGIARDGITGELILPQVLAAALSGPEGGFVEYFYDDPTDDTDSADVPKVGYARQFKGERERADGTSLPINFVVGSGFYMRAPDIAVTGPPYSRGGHGPRRRRGGVGRRVFPGYRRPPVQLRMERRHQCQWRIYPDHLQPGRGERLLPCPRPLTPPATSWASGTAFLSIAINARSWN